ncbi:hypothetical protein NBRC116188_24140 [Oceaniserpentilla sp. 4NH20-0058]|uniref:hypothetical protein n=1 Tax=Oceaniserpentilla sp. 4NH20-0058 TaxID=3127660 RepID=UPI003103D5E0
MHAHGQFNIWLNNRVVLARIKGQCNEDLAHKYAHAFREAIKPLSGKPWAHILYLDDWDLATPEVEVIMTDLVRYLALNGLTCSAQVFSSHALKQFQLNRIVKEKKEAFKRRTFNDQASAVEWLASEGFSLTNPT